MSLKVSSASTPKPLPSNSSSSLFRLALPALVLAVLAYFYIHASGFSEHSSFRALTASPRPSWNALSPLEQARWNASHKYSFAGSKPIPDFADKTMRRAKALLLKDSPASSWPALRKWKDAKYITSLMPTLNVHTTRVPVVRLHQADETHPFAALPGVNWTRPWLEDEIYTDELFKCDKLMYAMQNLKHIPSELRADINVVSFSVPWSPPMEVNLWMGTPFVTTPAHYDMVHNFYTQVTGMKRWIIFPPLDALSLYTFPSVHPSGRQSQVDFNNQSSHSHFPRFSDVHALEIILQPGDVLYIPPFWFHYVSAVGEEVSMSISTHTESQEAKVRERVMGVSEKFWSSLIRSSAKSVQWNTASLSSALKYYIEHVLINEGEENAIAPRKFIEDLLASRWSHLQLDRDVTGLVETLEDASKNFLKKEEIAAVSLPDTVLLQIRDVSQQIRGSYKEVSPAVKEIMLGNHVEEISARVLGVQNVLAFLRAVG